MTDMTYTPEQARQARLDLEYAPGDWKTIKVYPDGETAEAAAEQLRAIGLQPSVSCYCGSYGYGECALCQDEQDALTPEQWALQDLLRSIDGGRTPQAVAA